MLRHSGATAVPAVPSLSMEELAGESVESVVTPHVGRGIVWCQPDRFQQCTEFPIR
jgi:hypothetical protein